MKKAKIIYWVFTAIIVLFDGVIPALTSNSEMAKQGIAHLGYPDYFRVMLTLFKVIGALVLIIPFFKTRIKEWAYAGFAFTFVSAFVSNIAVDGFSGLSFFPLVGLALLVVSYIYYNKLLKFPSGNATQLKKYSFTT